MSLSPISSAGSTSSQANAEARPYRRPVAAVFLFTESYAKPGATESHKRWGRQS
jgi:hypothetical protein